MPGNQGDLHDQGIPEFARPTVAFSAETEFWQLLHQIANQLRLAGFSAKAQEYVKRAQSIPDQSTAEGRWELAVLSLEYVRLPDENSPTHSA